jgi:hypothetical protein
MSAPQDGTRRKHQKKNATRKLAEWRAKQAEKPAAAPAKPAAAKK